MKNLAIILTALSLLTWGCSDSNLPPKANAGLDTIGAVGVAVELDGTGSTDPENDSLTYLWSIDSAPDGSTATIGQPTSATATITPDAVGEYVISLKVNDGEFNNVDTVTIRTFDIGDLPATGDVTVLVIHDETTIYGWQPQETASATDSIIRLYYPNLVERWTAGEIFGTEMLIPVSDALHPDLYTVIEGDIVLKQ